MSGCYLVEVQVRPLHLAVARAVRGRARDGGAVARVAVPLEVKQRESADVSHAVDMDGEGAHKLEQLLGGGGGERGGRSRAPPRGLGMGRDWREGRGQRVVGACSSALLRARGEGEAEDERRGEAAEDLLELQPDAVLVQADSDSMPNRKVAELI